MGRADAPGRAAPLLHGLGDAEGILEVIARGIDMFDCVLPTRTARTGSALTARGRLNLRNARFARDPRPLEEGCACPACAGNFASPGVAVLLPALLGTPFLVAGMVILGIRKVARGGQ